MNSLFKFTHLKEFESSISSSFLLGTSFGLIALIGFPATLKTQGSMLFFIGLLIALASFVSGFFTGCLFGMPKRNPDENSSYTLNNSLVEVSDWLTKIIVGLGLVNLVKIPEYLTSIGNFVKTTSGIQGNAVEVYTICLVVFFSVFGLYLGYNYMRLILSQKYKASDDNMLRRELETAKNEVQKQKTMVEEKRALADNLLRIVNKADQPLEVVRETLIQNLAGQDENNDSSSLEGAIDTMVETAKARTRKGLMKRDDDPQKGQWGGKSMQNHRQIQARVDDWKAGLFHIQLIVTSTHPDEFPLKDGEVVLFALHDTFGDPPIRLVKVESGSAELELVSYGSFTVGILADLGQTELELDLAELPNVSDYFKKH